MWVFSSSQGLQGLSQQHSSAPLLSALSHKNHSTAHQYSQPQRSGDTEEQRGRRPEEESLGKSPENIFALIHWFLDNYVPSYTSLTLHCTTQWTPRSDKMGTKGESVFWQMASSYNVLLLKKNQQQADTDRTAAVSWLSQICRKWSEKLGWFYTLWLSLEREKLAKVISQLTSWSQDCKGNQHPKESFGVWHNHQTSLIYI